MKLQRAIGFGLVACAGMLSTGCTDNNVSIFVRQVQDPDTGSEECFIEADPEAPFISAGLLDIARGGGAPSFYAKMLFGNQLVARASPNQLRSESNRVQLYEAEVEVFDFSGATIATSVQPITGFADPGAASTPGWGIATVRLIDGATGVAIGTAGGQEVVARVRLIGETLGGLEVETGLFDFPVTVCNDCSNRIIPESCDDEIPLFCRPAQVGQVDVRLTDDTFTCPDQM